MSGFKALNVESESEEEIDDTKEIQTEEAFKLYQTALKLHSQGPLYYDEARTAYDELFRSDLFKYPEALSEFAHDLVDDTPILPVLPTEIEPVLVLPSNAAESSANAIPHLVYLAHKNHGQFELDYARHQASGTSAAKIAQDYYDEACNIGLKNFAEALERDDTDIDLWKKAARVAEVLATPRIARFCLESVLAGDDDSAQSIDLSGLDEAFAAGELKDLVALLKDDLSQLRSAGVHPKPLLLSLLRKSNNSYPFLPSRDDIANSKSAKRDLATFPIQKISLTSNSVFDEFVDAAEDLERTPSAVADGGDIAMTDGSEPQAPITETVESPEESAAVVPAVSEPVMAPPQTELPSRKRNSTTAGNDDNEGRIKSKRLRARESMHDMAAPEEELVPEPTSHQSWNWTVLKAADADMLKQADHFLQRLDLAQYGNSDSLWESASGTHKNSSAELETSGTHGSPAADLCAALRAWTDECSQAILHGHGSQDFTGKTAGLTLFQQHLKVSQPDEVTAAPVQHSDDIAVLIKELSQPSTTLYDAVFAWFLSICTSIEETNGKSIASSYLREIWPAELKQLVVQLLVRTEQPLISMLEQLHTRISDSTGPAVSSTTVARLTELVLTIFELHIDIHSAITHPSSQVNNATRIEQTDRLERWALLTDMFIRIYSQVQPDAESVDDLLVRFLWASTTYAAKADDVDRSFVMTGLQDLQRILQEFEVRPIALPNNAAMPLISAEAAEQESFRLSTLDFFMSVFDTENDDSVAVIERLEPIMEADLLHDSELLPDSEAGRLIQFLNSGDAALRLFLWRRLQNAYTTISYTPKVISCLFRALETIVQEIQRVFEAPSDESVRQLTLLKWLKDADELLSKILSKASGESNAMEALDEEHLRSSLVAVTCLLKVVHVHALYEDQVRFGMMSPPTFKGAASAKLYEKSKDRFREMHVHLWCVQYLLFKEATTQYAEQFPDAANDLADYLCTTHHALGQRHYCRYANKQLVRLVKSELNTLKTTNNYLGDMAQVMFDLYQLRFKNTEGDFEHGCSAENLDKKTAISLIPMVTMYAKQLPMKDLLKSELRNTIEKVQAASGTVKSGPIVLQNRKLMGTYLKSQLIPDKFYKAYKGQGGLVTLPIEDDDSIKAKHGWYFLLGHITLAKFRSVKRVSPTPTDDLDTAATLLRQDLEHNSEKWETWWRLAQIYEAKIEDDLIWNAAKLNDSRADIASMERHSIHCFLMATTMAMRTTDDDTDTAQKIQDMFREFAIRLYSSSRPPLSMEAFKTDKTSRHLSNLMDQSMSKVPLNAAWTPYQLWKYAAGLLRKKFTNRPKPWNAHYYHHKCLWKIFQSPENQQSRHPITPQDVLDPLLSSIAALPRAQKASDTILEPHIRLVSVLHKLVRLEAISPHFGAATLKESSRFATGLNMAEDEYGPDWEQYLLNVLKRLTAADKANWQHRIINRAAHIIYDSERNIAGALGAKHEFTQQIFTKTMTYQVWKPENERAGRHYVYTGQYVSFFAHLLDQLQDRGNLDQLVRRVRRKYQDFINHTQVWEHLATTYVRLLRRVGKIPEGRERALFDNTSFEEFSRLSELLEVWALDGGTSSVVLDIMRDAIDLKKLNNSLLKGGIIDDLIGDAYACLYEAFVSQLSEAERAPPQAIAATAGPSFINVTPDHVGPNGILTEHGLGINTANTSPSHHFVTPLNPIHDNQQNPSTPGPGPIRAVPPNKPGRAKTITRREVQRKAEAAIAKPPPIKTPTLSKRPVIEIPSQSRRGAISEAGSQVGSRINSAASSRRGSIASSRRNSVGEGSADGDEDEERDGDDGEAGNEADDESELSDAGSDEEGGKAARERIKSTKMFPKQHNGLLDGAGSDADDDDEEDDEGEDAVAAQAAARRDWDQIDVDERGNDVEMGEADRDGTQELEIPESQNIGDEPAKDDGDAI
ncbi:Histone transcription regulator-like protein [Cyphellophora attinorum]|uniref:Histone transcription regulator 3 homolog n=1 Tax=Cyphellophora attinorum TaxID=1664694 RepID=A0A0N1HA15_9EURO|nr:Histone transcription regulator-like protein [Phialophora attinorum]KPI44584.1 Histone transcription regulator-like protein [Phialophora attinorum]